MLCRVETHTSGLTKFFFSPSRLQQRKRSSFFSSSLSFFLPLPSPQPRGVRAPGSLHEHPRAEALDRNDLRPFSSTRSSSSSAAAVAAGGGRDDPPAPSPSPFSSSELSSPSPPLREQHVLAPAGQVRLHLPGGEEVEDLDRPSSLSSPLGLAWGKQSLPHTGSGEKVALPPSSSSSVPGGPAPPHVPVGEERHAPAVA